jgi:hypothetical protein
VEGPLSGSEYIFSWDNADEMEELRIKMDGKGGDSSAK